MQAGANDVYELLWVILIGMMFALIIQSLAANLGVTTGKHLAELCKVEYPPLVKYCLWLLAEVAVIAADIPEGISLSLSLIIMPFIISGRRTHVRYLIFPFTNYSSVVTNLYRLFHQMELHLQA
ncbi:metal transporter Nramp1-like [Eucalyptus grandis]|uniref:metal transporter Nramp1-like n=1 Tax=Eucalyptus grandis TaxID=71139 RepID=UPI00192EBEAB|nr:metal transporter Nramp1-like [Eucalyptus grandis]